MAGKTTCTLRDLFLNTSVRDECISLMTQPFAKTCGKEALGNGTSHGHSVTLTERAGCILDSALGVKLGVTGCGRSPLTELSQLVNCVVTEEGKDAVEHGRHVTGIEEETVAAEPLAIIGISDKEL